MLPMSYELPVAAALVLGGAVACFAGYRLFRLVLAIYGFIAGAMVASSMMASSNTIGTIVAALLGGVAGSLLLFFAYFVGIALVGAGLGAFILQAAWTRFASGDPPWGLVLAGAAVGTVIALVLQRYVIIVGTSFSGAWMIVLGALALTTRTAARGSPTGIWILYPLTPLTAASWPPLAWIVLGLFGMVVQLAVTSRKH
jgi:hypothetical protein